MTLSAEHRAALSDLVHRYAAHVDDREFAAAARLFTADAELLVPTPPADLRPTQTHRGQDSIATAVAAVATVLRTEHAIIGEVYDAAVRPGTARGRIACVAHHWDARGGELVDAAWHLRYDDEYALTEAGWRIARRALTVNAIETRPVRRLLPRDPA
ncbi:nuclear transport factor 2 family protein [Mycobacterium arosiense]|uniref:SnoaL-like domain-containing protein n=1 Tax=Mycobacterium arosiense ATCC BAA-1401 = DSM 45069 TaxID=1265311 RepID=A0A1W9ZB49_MYCAI|nr:nuclear transport factor 2 family protein [Mycobacterium arosiense]ORA11093.1 hypothetical protein BST14_19245 [Mycobacterium arosiense ATCC BAA-1401 = DSM 45069]